MKLSGLGIKLDAPKSEPGEIVSGLIRIDALPVGSSTRTEQVLVPMSSSERRKVRRRLVCPDGLELGLALPTGTVLEPGQVLHSSATKTYFVAAADEDVLVISTKSLEEAVKISHAVGNLHRDVFVDGNDLHILTDGAAELLLVRMDIKFARRQIPFLGKPSWEHQ